MLQEPDGVNHLLYQFDTRAHLRAWEQSRQRADLIARGDELSVEQRQLGEGCEAGWFAIPSKATVPKWKAFLTTWVAVYPTLLVISTVITQATGGRLPIPLQLAFSSLALTAALTWLIMPRLTRALRLWLLDTAPNCGPRMVPLILLGTRTTATDRAQRPVSQADPRAVIAALRVT